MYAATADQFDAELRQDLWWLRSVRWMVHPDREHDLPWRVSRWVLLPITFPLMLLYAQAFPYLVDKTVSPILRQLPEIKDRKVLQRVEDLFRLLHELMREFRRYSLAKKKIAYWLEELDEQLDSLEFIREHGDDLDSAIAQVRTYHAEQDSA